MRKRWQFTPEFKTRVVLDILTAVQCQAEACRKHGVSPNPRGDCRHNRL
jgi:transposase-like protein